MSMPSLARSSPLRSHSSYRKGSWNNGWLGRPPLERISEGGKRIDTGAKSLVFAKNATVVILVMVLGAENSKVKKREEFGGQQHRKDWSRKVDPK
jgi:hypothetical protein